MKKRALGSFCLGNYILSIFFLLLLVVAFVFGLFVDIGFAVFLMFIVAPLPIFVIVQIILTLKECWYTISDSKIIISNLIGKKKRSFDFLTVSEGMRTWSSCRNSYQPEIYELNFEEIKEICFLSEYKINKSGLRRNDICFMLKDNKKAYLSRNQFSKKQVLEIVNTMLEKNSNIELGERLKRELKIN